MSHHLLGPMQALISTTLGALLGLVLPAAASAQGFTNYESPHSHSIRLSADGSRLVLAHTADNRLAVFSLQDPSVPTLIGEVLVGLEPVAVALLTGSEAWVVNRLSDSISVVSLPDMAVLDTIRVGDEPADILFAGKPLRAFVSIAGTNQVAIFDPTTRRLVKTLDVLGTKPHSLAASEDGSRVFVAILHSGNKTTILPRKHAPPQPKPTNPKLFAGPSVAKIVRSDNSKWKSKINVDLPDHDVFEIDAQSLAVVRSYQGTGTTLFAVAARPGVTGGQREIWVANTEARNLVQMEPNLRGHVVDNRVTRIMSSKTRAPVVQAFDLNPGVDYTKLPNPQAIGRALAQPTDLVFDPKGTRLYVAAFGTDRIGVLDPTTGKVLARIEIGNTSGAKTDPRRKRGPRAMAHHPTRNLLYVLNRLSSSVSVVDTRSHKVLRELAIGHDPTPTWLREGRGFLYDAKLSGNGTMSCASCHIDGDHDHLAWDLGDPNGTAREVNTASTTFVIHPMKGPMTTQTLGGLRNLAPYHWRGDRPSLHEFNPAFRTLLGQKELTIRDLNDFVRFLESIELGPNPNQNLDRTFPTAPRGESAYDGFQFFQKGDFGGKGREKSCVECHKLPSGSTAEIRQGRNTEQYFKVPHLRNVYKRLGRVPVQGKRAGGFGLLHAGDMDSVEQLLKEGEFFGKLRTQPAKIRMLQRFILAFDTGTAPAVGYSRTVRKDNLDSAAVRDDLKLLLEQAAGSNCDLVASGLFHGEPRGFLYDPARSVFVPDRAAQQPLSLPDLERQLRAGNATLTFLGVPPKEGRRVGIDRDSDGVLDGDEGVLRYGPAVGCTGKLDLGANSSPRSGNSEFALVCTNMPPRTMGLIAMASRPANVVLPSLLVLVDPVAPLVFFVPTDASGVGLLRAPVAANAALVSRVVHAQAFAPSACGPLGVSASLGLKITVQR